ncbi:E3 ubiquitin-protein ligase Topors-like [Carassius carassius]|uniref:E3 ubiquitin-protein ligase Topors-like n=1 Tax=Carassius carassius TaxID=217509 RepID=UPI0028683EEC|nr:E3 ubiquitin-protein ligase Topors-like [Carassius carassius]
MASPQMKERPSGVVLNTISKGASPESKCPICLDHYKNISYLDVCLHKFCFCCIHEWSKNKAECPLCKQPFNSIYHTIKSEDNYQKFDLRPTENGSFGNMAGQRFRYRTTLTGERRPAPRRTSSPPDHGVLFEGLRGSVPQRHNRDLHSMLRRLAEERQRREREGRSLRSLHEQQAVKFRRALYRRGVRVQNVEDGGRSRETSAEFFRRNPACLHRLVPWVRRELTVLYGSHGSLANIVQHIIMTLITRHNLDEQPVLHELRPFLLTHTEHFLHEFLSFARSPFNMEAYDQRAVYDLPQPSGEISRSETSVISISEDESDALVTGSQDYGTPSVTLSQAPWDDETPGPSYSSEPSQVLPFHVRDSDSDSSVGEAVESVAAVPHQDQLTNPGTVALEEEHSSGSDEDCVIVGYVKPASERTPELVLLSSDSEPSEQNTEPQSPDLSPADTQRNTSTRSREDKSGERHHERELSGSRNRSSRSTRTQSSSHGREHQLSKNSKHKRRRENESSFHSSYSHYSQRDSNRRCYTETCSSYTSYYRSVHRSRSQSHRRRRSRDHQDRSHSRSNSRINSSNRHSRSNSRINSSNRHSRSNSRINSSNRHSRSNSRINSSNRHSRSNSRINSSNRHSRSNSRINSSNRLDRSHSRSNSRINSSNRHSRSNSRINSSNRLDRSHSRSNSRINSSNRHSRSNSRINSSNRHSRSNSRINSSNRHSRSNSRINSSNRHSRSNSRINSSNRLDRSHSRSNSRINSSNRHSRSNSRINSSNRLDRSHSRSNSRINSSNRHSRSNSRINSSNRHSRSNSRFNSSNRHSRSNSRINSSNRLDRSHSRSNSRINSSNRHSRSNSRINSSNRLDRSHSRSNSRINSSSHQTSHYDDHGRKKKYKTKHHEEPSRKSSSQLVTNSIDDGAKKKTKKHKKFKRKSRSPSIDDRSEGHGRKHHKKKKNKKKHKRKSRKLGSEERVGKNSPVFITIPSDSDEADPSEPSARNISAADSTVTIANRATDSQPLDVEQESAAGAECSSVCDAGNRPQTD